MTEPVTPDREALIQVALGALANHGFGRQLAVLVVDALLPLLTEALDRARQQGEETGREKAAQAIDRYRAAVTRSVYEEARLHEIARLARGGPNRKDEE